MKATITAIRQKEMPSKFGGTWKLTECKLTGDGLKPTEVYQLAGYSTKTVEYLKAGSEIIGYPDCREWQGKEGVQTTLTFNKISAEYVYDLLMQMKQQETKQPTQRLDGIKQPVDEWNNDGKTDWDTSPVDPVDAGF